MSKFLENRILIGKTGLNLIFMTLYDLGQGQGLDQHPKICWYRYDLYLYQMLKCTLYIHMFVQVGPPSVLSVFEPLHPDWVGYDHRHRCALRHAGCRQKVSMRVL